MTQPIQTDGRQSNEDTGCNRKPLQGLTRFQTDLLRTVEVLNEPNGLEIKRRLEHDYGYDGITEEIGLGRLYPNLDKLVDHGLVEKSEFDGRSNTYTLTERGADERAAHVAWEQGDEEGAA